jgi:hypothetical protein
MTGFLMSEVSRSACLSNDSAWILATAIRNDVSSKDDLQNRNGGTPPACRIALMLIIMMALVNVTSTMLMLRGWLGRQFPLNDATGVIFRDPSSEEQTSVQRNLRMFSLFSQSRLYCRHPGKLNVERIR